MQAIHGGDIYRNEVKMDFSVNINPMGLSEEIKASFNNIAEESMAYPDLECQELREALAREHGVDSQQIVCGNGASEILLGLVHAIKPDKILMPVPSFTGYERATIGSNAMVKFWHLKEADDFSIGEDLVDELENKYDMVFVCNPNNPTGGLMEEDILSRLIKKCEAMGTWLVMDNCFMDFVKSNYNIRELIAENKRLVIVKAFTKFYAMPGIRLGYAICGNPRMVMNLRLHLPEWNVSVLAQKAGIAALASRDYYSGTVELIARERRYLEEELKKIFQQTGQQLKIYKGQANFIFFRTEVELYEALLAKGILIRNCANYRLLGSTYYRIAVKKHEDNVKLIAAIKEVVNG